MTFSRSAKGSPLHVLALALVVLVVGVVSVAAAGAASSKRPGTLDKSFSENGRASVNLVAKKKCGSGGRAGATARSSAARGSSAACNDTATSVAIDTKGRIVIAGVIAAPNAYETGVVRYKPNGTLDTSFSNDGIARLRGTGFEIATDSQDRIVIGPDYGRRIVRLSSDGSVDESFGDNGVLDVPGTAFTVDSSDRIVVGSYRGYPVGPGGGLALERYLPDGSLDPSFDGSQIVELSDYDNTGSPKAIAIDHQGGIIVSDSVTSFDDPQSRRLAGLAKFLPDGGIDDSFGSEGTLTRGPFDFNDYNSLAIDSEDRIIAGGGGFIDRYLPDGTADDSFAGDGRLDRGTAEITIDDQDRMIDAAGKVYRFRPSGNIDPSFGNNGVAENSKVSANDVAIDRHGRIVSVGSVESHFTHPLSTDFAVARHRGG